MADTGLLISHAFNLKTIMGNELYLKLALGKLEVNEGMLTENVVAQMLKAAGHELFFFSKNSATNAQDKMEIDFLISKPVITNRHNISPIEVKSGNSYTITSLQKTESEICPHVGKGVCTSSCRFRGERWNHIFTSVYGGTIVTVEI